MLTSLVYVSRASRPMERSDLHAILTTSRAHNREADITGVLLFGHGNFLQLIEGEDAEVDALYASIRRDERHHDVTTIRHQPARRRQFPDWRMGFGDMDVDGADKGPLVVISGDQVDPFAAEIELLRELLRVFDPQP